MIPIRDVIPSRTVPVITIGLIVLNSIVFFYQLSLGAHADSFLTRFALLPAHVSLPTLVTSMFLHAGVLHFGGNMIYLWIFGDTVEDRMGHTRFMVFYLLCGAAVGLLQAALSPESGGPFLGASGAIAGVMGAYFVLYPRSKVVTILPLLFLVQFVEIPAVFFLGFWFILQFFGGMAPGAPPWSAAGGVTFWAHVTGFVVGAVAVVLLKRPERLRVEWWDHV